MDAVEAEAGISASVTLKGGLETGTYVAKELVYAYAMWISPAFHLKVNRAYDAMQALAVPQVPIQLMPTAIKRSLTMAIGRGARTPHLRGNRIAGRRSRQSPSH